MGGRLRVGIDGRHHRNTHVLLAGSKHTRILAQLMPSGGVHSTGYAGYNRLIGLDRIGPDIRLAYCRAHARRKLVEITRNGSAPIAEDGVNRTGELYRIEAELRGLDQEPRLAGRQERSAPVIADMQTWLVHHRARVATKCPLGEALAYIAKYWKGLKLFFDDGRIEIDTDVVEQPLSHPFCGLGGLSLQASTMAA